MEQTPVPHSNGLVEGNSHFQQLAQNAPIAIAMFDTRMNYLFANDRWLADFHLSVSEIAGKSFYDVFTGNTSEWKRANERGLAGETIRDDGVLLPNGNGSKETINREVRPWYKAEGEVGGIIMYAEVIGKKRTQELESEALLGAALEEQRQFLRQIIDLIPHFIFAKDNQGRFTLVNKIVADVNGSTPDEMVGKTDGDFNPNASESQQFHTDDIQVIQTREPMHIPEEAITNATTGETRWYQTIKVPLERPDGSVQLLGVSTDITERKQARDELASQQNYLRQIIDLNPAFIFAKDGMGKFTLVNKTLADAYGATPEEIIGKSDADFNPNEEEVKAFWEADREVIRSGQPKFIPEEPVYDSETGESRWYQTIKVPIKLTDGNVQLLGVATDITERKKAEEALREQQDYLRQIIDLNPSFIFAKDEAGKFTLVNKALADAYASKPEEMVGKSDGDYNPNEEEVKAFLEADLEVIRSGQPKFIPEETVYDSETGESRWFQTIKVPIVLADGSKQLLGVATDITERKESDAKREELLKRERIARREAEEAVRMKDLFLATMSHELRTPLNAMIGFLNLMIFSGQMSDDNTHMAQRSLANSQRLLGLINNILDLSRIATGRLEIVPVPFRPRELAYQLIEDLDVQAKQKGLRLELELGDDLPTEVMHDEERIIQITTNLLGNAIKFTDVGRVKLAVSKDNEKLVIEVTDTGPGIPPASQHVIFDDFVQLDSSSTRKHGGAGLGLSIVNKLAILMNGSVKLTSEVGKGSKFRVELPLELVVPVKSEEEM
jgi:PAS domain S-box-containing protein